jgi:hypothetical protein
MDDMAKVFLSGLVAGLVGGFVGAYVLIHLDGRAAPPRAPLSSRSQDVISAKRIQLVDAGGKVRAELAMALDGGPSLFFFDTAGRNRLVLGLYSPAEGEAPTVVLNDSQEHAAGIFRLFGAHDTPVVVLKNQGRDRSVYGLNPGSMDPFLANYAADGRKTDLFGDY